MTISASDNEYRTMNLAIGTGTNHKTGKEYIYCEISYLDKETKALYNKVFPASKYDGVCRVYRALENGLITPKEATTCAIH